MEICDSILLNSSYYKKYFRHVVEKIKRHLLLSKFFFNLPIDAQQNFFKKEYRNLH